MRDRYRLAGVENEALVAALFALVRRENDVMSDLLAHLAELDERRLYLDLGFTSLFAYCTEALGLCRSSAGRRIAVARVCRRYPEAFGHVARGELQLSVLSLLGPHLNPENAAELFAACGGKSCEQVELLLAARFPKPDVRDAIRRLPNRAERPTPDGGRAIDTAALASLMHREANLVDAGASDAPLMPPAGPEHLAQHAAAHSVGPAHAVGPAHPVGRARRANPAQHRLEPLSADRFGVRFTVDAEFRELLEEVRALASQREPSGDLMSLMKRGLEAYRRELQKRRFGAGSKPRRARSRRADGADPMKSVDDVDMGKGTDGADSGKSVEDTEPTLGAEAPRRSRHIPAAVARAVYLRHGGGCTFCSEDGRRCGARRFLELDHITPWAAHGESTVENLRLRCRAHNLHSARSYFGEELVRAMVALQQWRAGRRRGCERTK